MVLEIAKEMVNEVEFWVGVVVLVHIVLVKMKVYERTIFFLSGRVDLVRRVIEFLISLLVEEKKQKVREILRDVGLFYYILVEKWGEREGKKGDEKFEKFLLLIKESLGKVEEWETNEIRESVRRFADIVNFIQKNTPSDRFIERAEEVIKSMGNGNKLVKVLGKVAKWVLLFFGIR